MRPRAPAGGYPECGHKMAGMKHEVEAAKIRTLKGEYERLVVDANALEILRKTRTKCPKCSFNEAYWMMRRTRDADEPETRFCICVRCGTRWRENQ